MTLTADDKRLLAAGIDLVIAAMDQDLDAAARLETEHGAAAVARGLVLLALMLGLTAYGHDRDKLRDDLLGLRVAIDIDSITVTPDPSQKFGHFF